MFCAVTKTFKLQSVSSTNDLHKEQFVIIFIIKFINYQIPTKTLTHTIGCKYTLNDCVNAFIAV